MWQHFLYWEAPCSGKILFKPSSNSGWILTKLFSIGTITFVHLFPKVNSNNILSHWPISSLTIIVLIRSIPIDLLCAYLITISGFFPRPGNIILTFSRLSIIPHSSSSSFFLNRLYFLQHLYVHNNIEQKVQRFSITSLFLHRNRLYSPLTSSTRKVYLLQLVNL